MGFDEQSTRRIVRTVLDSERRNQSTPGSVKRPRGKGGTASVDVRLRATIDKPGGLTSPYDPFPVDNVEVITGAFAEDNLEDVHNDLKWDADDGALVYIEFVASKSTAADPYYHAYQVECPSA